MSTALSRSCRLALRLAYSRVALWHQWVCARRRRDQQNASISFFHRLPPRTAAFAATLNGSARKSRALGTAGCEYLAQFASDKKFARRNVMAAA